MPFVAWILATALLGGPPPQKQEPLFDGIGTHVRKISTDSHLAQRYFDQGMAFLYGFNHGEAARSFREATQADPKCAMAWWGLALSNGPHINNPSVDADASKTAVQAITRARSLEGGCTPTERELIEAATKRYASPPPADRGPLDRAFADAMREVWRRHPKDADVGALFAESMMDLRPWDLWKADGTPQPGTEEIMATLKAVLKLDPMHPQGNHLWIHTMEASPYPAEATASADRLRFMEPAIGHMVHMPSHIYVRTGRWKEAVQANLRAIKADNDFRKLHPGPTFYGVYMAHNRHMLAYAAAMRGQSKLALKAVDEIHGIFPESFWKDMAPFLDGFAAMPIEFRKRFGLWDEVLKAPDLPEYFPVSRAMRHAARAVAFAAKGQTMEARAEQTLFEAGVKAVPPDAMFGNNTAAALLEIDRSLVEGEICIAEGKDDKGIQALYQAVAAEDQTRYDEPPDWIQPIRHTLGAALLKVGRPKEALQVYLDDLKKLPNNGWSLLGASQAYGALGQTAKAAAYRKRFDQVWSDADMSIDSSCLCIQQKP